MSEDSSTVAGVKRKMRKGTQSCVECRRRKIKCTFIHGDARCANCLARGTQCIDQRDVDGTEDFSPEDSATSLRERVAILERQLADVVQTIKNDLHQNRVLDRSLGTPEESDIEPPIADPKPPPTFNSVVNDIYGDWNFRRTQGSDAVQVTISERKASELCKTLRSQLPDLDTLLDKFRKHGSWWSHWRRQVQPQGEPIEGITTWVRRIYASSVPGDVGCLVTAYARQMWKGKFHLYGYVESLVTSDAVFCSTMEGMECVVLLAQCYMDVGQPRRSWLTYQRGIAFARLMGLDQHFERDNKKAALWWSMYLGDRLSSMVLGLPCTVHDFQYGLHVGDSIIANAPPQRRFMVRCALVAGRIMDRCARNGVPFTVHLTNADDLELEMDSIAASQPPGWWDLPKTLPEDTFELDELRAGMLQQSYYFHVRMHIDLSHLGEAPGSPYWQSKLKCMEAARQQLRRGILLSLRLGEENFRFFECKTNDFVGFIAASILTIGLFSLGNDVDQEIVRQDQILIDSMKTTFHREELLKRCQVARQCGRTLDLLKNPRQAPDSVNGKIVIPYFGTVVRKTHPQPSQPVPNGVNTHDPSMDLGHLDGRGTNWLPQAQQQISTQSFGLDGQAATDLFSDNLYWELENSGGYMTDDFNPMLDPAMVDLSQDWSMFSSLDSSPSNYAF